MDRLNQLRGGAGGSGDSMLDTTSPPSEAYESANESTSKYFSLSEVDSTFDISSIKDVSLASTTDDSRTVTDPDELISNLSPISKKNDMLDSYKIGKQIEAANILSGGVDIFDDNENSYDGDELVIDDNAEVDEKSNSELKITEFKEENMTESTLDDADEIASKDTEVVLQIDGKNVDAIDIGNGIYLYRKEGQEELAAVQIIDDDQQQPSFKFLKVRENAEGNLEVYEEIEIEVPKEVPSQEGKQVDKNTSHVPIKDINKVICDSASNKVVECKNKVTQKEHLTSCESVTETNKDLPSDCKPELNLNGKMMKFSESRKSPIVGSFTPMTYHSTPNKEGIPLTKTMVNQQLHPSRHSDNKKTIEVHTDSSKKLNETNKKDSLDKEESEVIIDKDTENKAVECIIGNKTDNDNKIGLKNENDSKDDSRQLNQTLNDKDDRNKLVETIVHSSGSKVQTPETMTMKIKETKTSNQDTSLKMLPEPETKISVSAEVSNQIQSNIKDKPSIDKNIEKAKVIEQDTPMSENVDVIKEVHKADENVTKEDSILELKVENTSTKNEKSKIENDVIETVKMDVDCISKQTKNNTIILQEERNIITSGNKNANDNKGEPTVDNVQRNEKVITAEKDSMVTLPDSIIVQNENRDSKPEIINIIDKLQTKKMVKNKDTISSSDIYKETSRIDNPTSSVIDKPIHVINKSELDPVKNDQQDDSKKAVKKLCDEKEKDKAIGDHRNLKIKADLEKHKITKPVISLTTEHDVVKNKVVHSLKTNSETKEKESASTHAVPNVTNENSTNIVPAIAKKQIECHEKVSQDEKKESHSKERVDFTKYNDKKDVIDAIEQDSKTELNKNSETSKNNTNTVKKADKIVEKQNEIMDKKELPIVAKIEQKQLNNNHAPVPFGQWTDANRQEFLNKFKETKPPVNNSNGKQIKNSNDLNRRDVLKKIDSQRQSSNAAAKAQETHKSSLKNETMFINKTTALSQEDKDSVKTETSELNPQSSNATVKAQETHKSQSLKNETMFINKATALSQEDKDSTKTQTSELKRQSSNAAVKAQETHKSSLKNETMTINKAIALSQHDKDSVKIETNELKQKPPGMKKTTEPETLSKLQGEKKEGTKNTVPQPEKSPASTNTEVAQKKDFFNAQDIIDITIEDMIHRNLPTKQCTEGKTNVNTKNASDTHETPYDDIEMKMNELHGIPFVERPPHELPNVNDTKLSKVEKEKPSKTMKIPNLLPFANKIPKAPTQEHLIEVESEEEVIEHEPITGDIDLNTNAPVKETHPSADTEQKEAIITENDFDKFARRNSVTYENYLTVNFDGREPHNVIQTVVEKDIPKKYPKNEMVRFDIKSKLPQKNPSVRQSTQLNKMYGSKTGTVTEDPSNKHYQSKLQMAYQSALTAKRQLECPITIIEDKPVKVVFIDSNAEYIPSQLNVQGQELSPAKKSIPEVNAVSTSTCDSLDSDVLDSTDETKSQDGAKMKTKHQRKQVLTPVEAPELELIQPGDLGIEISPKKKRKTEDSKYDKHSKNLIHKKSYLLGRTAEEKTLSTQDLTKSLKDMSNKNETFHREPVSAIDSLVKAAELLENQTENINTSTSKTPNPDSQQTTPVKRGRGRPRKYPLPEGADKNNTPSPQKKPRLIDAKPPKRDTTTEDEETTDDEIIKENWTMGKINENIVCPICNKLFRSENVVFKHVKHCTGVSPSRSESEKRSPRRVRQSQESESKSEDMDIDDDKPISSFSKRDTPIERISKDSTTGSDANKDEVIVIEDTPIKSSESKEKPQKSDETKQDSKKSKTKISKIHSLVCEFCGKSFRQNSYLVSHKLQHMKDEKKLEKESSASNKSVFTCEVCKKAFRKLHHLVQHRLIHNNALPSRVLRKSSSEQTEGKERNFKEQGAPKQNDDPSAGFRCEPCDKSFRKLHHLVEHRETHDGINRQKTTTVTQSSGEKPTPPPPECDICKKTFRKLHHLIEHKEQHNETSSEKSDDKSVKSTLSTKDIIHECSLCYMVFPNEHSLNKHTIICQRKKRQSKQAKSTEESQNVADAAETKQEETKVDVSDNSDDMPKEMEISHIIEKDESIEASKIIVPEQVDNEIEIIETSPINIIEVKSDDAECTLSKPEPIGSKPTTVKNKDVPEKAKEEYTEKIKKAHNDKEVKVRETPKKKTPLKDKVAHTVTKRKKTIDMPLPVVDDVKPAVESSDDDEVRYMLNPDFKEEAPEDKLFMKVRAKKRNSLQIERPNSKDLVKRRTSLQHPPKIPRKLKQNETKAASTSKNTLKTPKLDPVSWTDSDDSDIKYSFPKPVAVKRKSTQIQTVKEEKPTPKKLSTKRKSLSSIAKRKSLGKAVIGRPKAKASPVKYVKRRTKEVGHRCDCGQLFSSAALLSRHTTLAHTPPRIRKRRSPPPEVDTKSANKTTRKPTEIPKPSNLRKSSVKSDTAIANKSVTRKSSVTSEVKNKAGKSDVSETSTKRSTLNTRRMAAHRGVPVPEKMRKVMQSFKK
ncbi:hypothetical protein K1T71_005399 [Dendrolimus kikuchii]|uniref:Uncharacterized protein n=1 Tax=Dendrolimus kikuchii TaxID=765133 RepID=A0ACC1D3W4_9NEOP|nr:hypothetical protein K1T71_005399 [Dendrolimus kikuchii]